MTKRLLFSAVLTILIISGFAQDPATFTTTAASVDWQLGPWAGGVGDTDGIPDSDDTVVVAAGHTLDWTLYNVQVADLTVNASGFIQGPPNLSKEIHVYGNYVNNGTELQRGIYRFKGGAGLSISGSGTFQNNVWWIFEQDRTIGADVNASKNNWVRLYNNADITNNGFLYLRKDVVAYGANSDFTNNGTVLLGAANFMETGSFHASAVGNLVQIMYAAGNPGQEIPVTTSGFYDLRIQTNAKDILFDEDIVVANKFVNASGSTTDMNGYDLNVGGDFLNYSTFQSSTLQTVTFDGSGAQSFYQYIGQPFPANVVCASGGTVTQVNDLDIDNGGGFTITSGVYDNNGKNINLEGDWTVAGGLALISGSAFVEFDGTSGAQTIDGPTEFYHLWLDNAAGVSFISDVIGVENQLDVQQGTFSNGGGTLVLRSSATGDAQVEPLCATCFITGTVNVERYMSGPGNYSDLASPCAGGVTLGEWDDDIYMSCIGGDDGDAWGSTCYVSAKYWDETAQTFADMSSIGDAVDNRRGYECYVAVDLFGGAVDTTITVSGTLHSDGALGSSFALFNGWNLIGNPYASGIDFDLIGRSSVGNYFLIFDSSTGSYSLYDGATGTGAGAVSDDGIVASGQGFWVEGSPGAKSVTFTQSDKSNDRTSWVKNYENDFENAHPSLFFMNITSKHTDFSGRSIVKVHTEALSQKDEYDASWLKSPEFDAPFVGCTTEDGVTVMMNAVNNYEASHTLPVVVRVGIAGEYAITFENLANFEAYDCITLEDAETGKVYDLKKSNKVTFNMQSVDMLETKFYLHLDNGCAPVELNIVKTENVSILPNEYGARISFEYPEETQATVELIDLTGRSVMNPITVDAHINTTEINVPENLNGVYLIVVTSEYGQVTRKVYY